MSKWIVSPSVNASANARVTKERNVKLLFRRIVVLAALIVYITLARIEQSSAMVVNT